MTPRWKSVITNVALWLALCGSMWAIDAHFGLHPAWALSAGYLFGLIQGIWLTVATPNDPKLSERGGLARPLPKRRTKKGARQ